MHFLGSVMRMLLEMPYLCMNSWLKKADEEEIVRHKHAPNGALASRTHCMLTRHPAHYRISLSLQPCRG